MQWEILKNLGDFPVIFHLQVSTSTTNLSNFTHASNWVIARGERYWLVSQSLVYHDSWFILSLRRCPYVSNAKSSSVLHFRFFHPFVSGNHKTTPSEVHFSGPGRKDFPCVSVARLLAQTEKQYWPKRNYRPDDGFRWGAWRIAKWKLVGN